MLIYVGKCLSFSARIDLFFWKHQPQWPQVNTVYIPANLDWKLPGCRQVLLCRFSEMIKQWNGLPGI